MVPDLPGGVDPEREEVLVEWARVLAGWEARAPGLDPVESVFVLTAGLDCRIK